MDWIKVKVKHILYEYPDLTEKEFSAWIKVMALTAVLEHEPTEKQLLQHIHHKTLRSLQEKLKTRSTDLQDIFKKVLIDVQEVVNKKEYWKTKKAEQRGKSKNVQEDMQETSKNREEKRREEKIREELNNKPLTPLEKTLDDFAKHRKNLKKPMTEKAMELLIKKLDQLTKTDDEKILILEQSIENGWQGIFELKNSKGISEKDRLKEIWDAI